jgi:hypothetical protein
MDVEIHVADAHPEVVGNSAGLDVAAAGPEVERVELERRAIGVCGRNDARPAGHPRSEMPRQHRHRVFDLLQSLASVSRLRDLALDAAHIRLSTLGGRDRPTHVVIRVGVGVHPHDPLRRHRVGGQHFLDDRVRADVLREVDRLDAPAGRSQLFCEPDHLRAIDDDRDQRPVADRPQIVRVLEVPRVAVDRHDDRVVA